MPRAEKAAIILAQMDMLQSCSQRLDGGRNILFFDVSVKGVDGDANVRVCDCGAELPGLIGRTQEERFGAVEIGRASCRERVSPYV